jgi:hypothetical protein
MPYLGLAAAMAPVGLRHDRVSARRIDLPARQPLRLGSWSTVSRRASSRVGSRGATMTVRFNPPPNWPAPPPGWTPPTDWQPDPSWPPPPDGWQFWVEDPPPVPPQWGPPVVTQEPLLPPASREPEPPVAPEEPKGRGVPIFGARKRAQELEDENAWLRQQLAALDALDHIELIRRRDELTRQRDEVATQVEAKRQELDQLTEDIVAASDLAVLQEVGGSTSTAIPWRTPSSTRRPGSGSASRSRPWPGTVRRSRRPQRGR